MSHLTATGNQYNYEFSHHCAKQKTRPGSDEHGRNQQDALVFPWLRHWLYCWCSKKELRKMFHQNVMPQNTTEHGVHVSMNSTCLINIITTIKTLQHNAAPALQGVLSVFSPQFSIRNKLRSGQNSIVTHLTDLIACSLWKCQPVADIYAPVLISADLPHARQECLNHKVGRHCLK